MLTILDEKKDSSKRDIVEKEDIDLVFRQQKFQDLCMRFYDPMIKQSVKPKIFFGKREKSIKWDREPFFEDIHKITILVTVKLFHKEQKDSFTLTEIQGELKKNQIELSPGQMREIINRLCLNGTFRLIEEPTIITPQEDRVRKDVFERMEKDDDAARYILESFKMDKPDIYSDSNETLIKFEYEFGVKIFPKILIASLDGINNCKKELISLVAKKNWEDWVRRYS